MCVCVCVCVRVCDVMNPAILSLICSSWLEEDPMILLSTVTDCIEAVCEECEEKGIDLKRIKGTCVLQCTQNGTFNR